MPILHRASKASRDFWTVVCVDRAISTMPFDTVIAVTSPVSGQYFFLSRVPCSIMAHYNFKKITVVPSSKVRKKRQSYCTCENFKH